MYIQFEHLDDVIIKNVYEQKILNDSVYVLESLSEILLNNLLDYAPGIDS